MLDIPTAGAAAMAGKACANAPRRRQALQARSQATEAALLAAGLAHFEEHGFEGLSMHAVAERAGASIGALYFRFGDREGFVQAVLERGFDQIRQETDALLAKATAEHASPHAVIHAFVDLAVRVQRKGHGVFRAVLRRALVDPQAWAPVGRLGNDATQRLVATLAQYPEVTAIPDWQSRLMFGVYAARGAHFNSFYNAQAPLPRSHAAMVRVLYELVVSYLGLPPEPSASEAHTRPAKAESERCEHTGARRASPAA